MEELAVAYQNIGLTAVASATLKHNNTERMAAALGLQRIAKFLEPALAFLNCHFTNYYVKSYWDALVPEQLRLDLESKSVEEVKKCMTDLTTGEWKSYPEAEDGTYNPNWTFQTVTTLEQLVVAAGKLKLSELQLCTPYKTLEQKREVLRQEYPDLFVDLEFDKFMSSKKMHEVLKFSEFIACACRGLNVSTTVNQTEFEKNKETRPKVVRQVVDVGSGKGYLSSFLGLYYDLKVLAIDASETNTDGCDKRSEKLDKTWPQLVRRAKERKQYGACTNLGRHWKKSLAKKGISVEQYLKSLQELRSEEKNLKSVTEVITTKTNLQSLVDSNFKTLVSSDDDDNNSISATYGIVGLHTCGNLGANILKLFIHNHNAKFICVIPCCYNLVRENENLYPEDVFYGSKFGIGPESQNNLAPLADGSIGFPMSKLLQHYKSGNPFVLGRNARMLSAYSLPRMVEAESGLEMSSVLYYRAMLQVLLLQFGLLSSNSEVGNVDDNDIRVGRMTKKCSSFKDYVTFAMQKLRIEIPDILTNGKLEDVESTFASPQMLDKFHKYYLMRTMYASIVEDFILLDRIMYLREQEFLEDANLVQLFDPALSPRSHAIVAVKRTI